MEESLLVGKFRIEFDNVKALEDQLEVAKSRLEETKQKLLDMMESDGKDRTATYEGIGFVTRMKPRLFASCSEENKPVLFDWIRKTGNEGLIKETVSPQTLSAFVAEKIEEGQEVPECISYTIKSQLRLYSK